MLVLLSGAMVIENCIARIISGLLDILSQHVQFRDCLFGSISNFLLNPLLACSENLFQPRLLCGKNKFQNNMQGGKVMFFSFFYLFIYFFELLQEFTWPENCNPHYF